jgi:succinate dehydrogenase/fumarate reductase flavoprotein subunit
LARREIPRIKEEGVKEEIIRLQRLIRQTRRRKQEPNKFADMIVDLNNHMLEAVGLSRNGQTLAKAKAWVNTYRETWQNRVTFTQDELETGNIIDLVEFDALLSIAGTVVEAAAMRIESRGVHQREDYPEQSGDWEQAIIAKHEDGTDVLTPVPISSAVVEFV